MVIIAIPQLAAVQEEVVELGGGDAGVAGVDVEADVEDIDMLPPQALKVEINKMHAAVGHHRGGIENALVGRCECFIEVSPSRV
jgi:hypothetical protein